MRQGYLNKLLPLGADRRVACLQAHDFGAAALGKLGVAVELCFRSAVEVFQIRKLI